MKHLFHFQYSFWLYSVLFCLIITSSKLFAQENNPPIVSTIGPSPTVVACGGNYIEFGANAFDDEDGILMAEIGGDCICLTTAGSYVILYTAIDSDSNCHTAERLVIVQGSCNEPCEDLVDCGTEDPCTNGMIGSSIWPGDTNNDGLANNLDLLPLGIAYGQTGPTRANASLDWTPQAAEDWEGTFLNGVNYKHVDGNGDGSILLEDRAAILQNYGKTNVKNVGKSGGPEDAPFYVELPDGELETGDNLTAPIILGTVETPAVGIYGIAFTVNFDSELVDSESVDVSFENCWLGTEGQNLITLSRPIPEEGLVDVAITRIDLEDQSAYGSIGTLTGIIDNVAGKSMAIDLIVSITNIQVINASEIEVPVFPTSDTVLVTDIEQNLIEEFISLFPNPTTSQAFLQLPKSQKFQSVRVFNTMGKLEEELTPALTHASTLQLELGNLPTGMYFLKINYDGFQVTRKLWILK